jgi:hypothetical protein
MVCMQIKCKHPEKAAILTMSDVKLCEGRVAIVTGAGRGMGRAYA